MHSQSLASTYKGSRSVAAEGADLAHWKPANVVSFPMEPIDAPTSLLIVENAVGCAGSGAAEQGGFGAQGDFDE